MHFFLFDWCTTGIEMVSLVNINMINIILVNNRLLNRKTMVLYYKTVRKTMIANEKHQKNIDNILSMQKTKHYDY